MADVWLSEFLRHWKVQKLWESQFKWDVGRKTNQFTLEVKLQTLRENELTQEFGLGPIWQEPTPSKSIYILMFCSFNQRFLMFSMVVVVV